jgi:hypothetical protein
MNMGEEVSARIDEVEERLKLYPHLKTLYVLWGKKEAHTKC